MKQWHFNEPPACFPVLFLPFLLSPPSASSSSSSSSSSLLVCCLRLHVAGSEGLQQAWANRTLDLLLTVRPCTSPRKVTAALVESDDDPKPTCVQQLCLFPVPEAARPAQWGWGQGGVQGRGLCSAEWLKAFLRAEKEGDKPPKQSQTHGTKAAERTELKLFQPQL